MLYLEDLQVGQQFTSRKYHFSLDEILEFAYKFDPQVFHIDPVEAEKHPIFKGLAASGWHTTAVIMRLWTECFTVKYGLIGSESHVRWKSPVRPNDEIYVVATIQDIKPSRSKTDRGMVTYQSQAFDQNDQLVFESTTKILVFKRAFDTV